MTLEIPTREPSAIIAGDSLKWDKALSDFPAPTWTLTYQLVGRFGSHSITAVASGTTHQVRELPATTLPWKHGVYRLVGRVSDGTDTWTVYDQPATITPSLSDQAEGFDPRSQNQRIFEAITATIEGRASKDQMSFSISDGAGNSRTLARMPIPELFTLRDRYAALAARDRRKDERKDGGGHGGRILAKFKT